MLYERYLQHVTWTYLLGMSVYFIGNKLTGGLYPTYSTGSMSVNVKLFNVKSLELGLPYFCET